MFMKKLIVLMLIICLLISMIGCGGVPTTPPISSESELVLVQVTDTKSNLISVAGEENEDAIAILGEKDIEGNPTSITGAVYVFEQGDSFGIDAGIDGLPTYLIDSEGNKVIFENYTNSTVDISMYDSNGSLIQDTATINVDTADLLELRQLYNSFYSQKKGWGKNVADDVTTGLKWGAKAIPWVACGVTVGVASVNPLLIVLPPFSVATVSCGSKIITTLASLGADYTISEAESEALTAEGCTPLNPLAYVSTVLNIIANEIEQGYGTNHAPIISSLTANSSSVDINQTTIITCTASDENVGDTLTYAWTKDGGTFEGSTSGSTIIWKAPSTKGSYTVTCEVSDGEASDSDQVIISVGDVNHAPAITSIAVTSATKGQPYSYDVNATDSDGDIPVYSLTTKPSGMTINYSTGLIAWTPTATGSFGVSVKVSDGELYDTQSFTITVEETSTTLGQVQLSSPSNGTTVNTSTVTLSWGSVSGATGYEVVYDTSSSFTNPIGWSVSGTSKTTGTLIDGTTYYWRVRAFAGSQYSSWSSVWSFTKSSALVPPTGLSVSSYWNTVYPGFPSMVLSWNAVSGATGYEMWVRPSGGSYASLGTRDAPYVTFNSNSLPGGGRYVSGTTYYFKVRTVTASGTSGFTSEVSCVAAVSSTIGTVQLSSPGNGFTLPPMNVTFIWDSVSNATKYEIIIYNPLGQVALDQTTTNIHIIVALGTEETITWKVRAGDNSGNWGAWSSTWSLIIKSLT